MITVISILYIGCVLVVFKYIKIPVRASTIAAAVVIGVVLLGGILIGWKFAAPMTQQLTLKRYIVPLAVGSKETIAKTYATVDQPVKKGDLLFEVRSDPFQYAVDQLTAQLAESLQNVSRLEAAVNVAAAGLDKAKADEAYAKALLDSALNVQKLNPSAVATLQVEVQRQDELAAQAGRDEATASLQEAKFALAATKSGIGGIEAQLNTAKLNLEQCVVKAPADGFLVNWQAREGTMATSLGQSAIGAFMDMTDTVIAGVFPQNTLKYVEPDNVVEIAFKSRPGTIATGKVAAILDYTGEGQVTPEGVLPVAADLGSKGYLVVRVKLDDEELARELPLGAAGALTIYTKVGRPFHVISRITIRIKGWMNYVPI